MDQTQRTRVHPARKKRSILPSLLLIILFVGVCVFAAAALLGVHQIPRMAEARFGTPSDVLGQRQLLWISLRLLLNENELVSPVNAQGQAVDFKVLLGESVATISGRLHQEGLIRDTDAFRDFLVYSGLDTGIQAGDYRLSPALNAMQIARALQDATPAEVTFAILPGWRVEEIAAALPTSGLAVTPEEFLALVHSPAGLEHPAAQYPTLEGFLYPDVYRVPRDISVEGLVLLFLERFDREVDDSLRDALSGQGYDLYEAVTLASIVQREAVVAEEQPMIASVFVNRLLAGMKLDSDPTVQYAVGYNESQKSWWTNPLSLADLQAASPYNTYIQTGLPPGPICNPTQAALRAVAYPAETPYYYFRARCDQSGKHAFARSYEEHLQNACE